ncbi:hypothetical protein [Nocardia sp. SSK8]|uniref:hypothetical protein n=1 Tax=Nocardia sp. SSK8 TaxID=3120154 RepID=UPI0030088DE8
MRRTLTAGLLVAALATGGSGIATAAPTAQSGSTDTGSALVDAAQVGALVALFGAHLLSCNLLGSSAAPCNPIGLG